VTSARISFVAQGMEDGRGGSCCGFAGFPDLPSFVMYLTDGEYVGHLCDGDGDKGLTALAVVGSQIAYGTIVDPDPVRLVGGCIAYIAGR